MNFSVFGLTNQSTAGAFSEIQVYVWLGLIVFGLVIEALTPQLVSIWMVFGCVGALIACFLGVPLWIQIVIALLVSVILLIATRPLVKKFTNTVNSVTNADRYIGKIAVVSEEIENEKMVGRVNLGDSSWLAYSKTGETIRCGTLVIVRSIEGNKLCVEERKVQL